MIKVIKTLRKTSPIPKTVQQSTFLDHSTTNQPSSPKPYASDVSSPAIPSVTSSLPLSSSSGALTSKSPTPTTGYFVSSPTLCNQ